MAVLAECVWAVRPLTRPDWHQVMHKYNHYARRAGRPLRSYQSLSALYHTLIRLPNPSLLLEDCPNHVQLARRASIAIEERARLLGTSQNLQYDWPDSDEEKRELVRSQVTDQPSAPTEDPQESSLKPDRNLAAPNRSTWGSQPGSPGRFSAAAPFERTTARTSPRTLARFTEQQQQSPLQDCKSCLRKPLSLFTPLPSPLISEKPFLSSILSTPPTEYLPIHNANRFLDPDQKNPLHENSSRRSIKSHSEPLTEQALLHHLMSDRKLSGNGGGNSPRVTEGGITRWEAGESKDEELASLAEKLTQRNEELADKLSAVNDEIRQHDREGAAETTMVRELGRERERELGELAGEECGGSQFNAPFGSPTHTHPPPPASIHHFSPGMESVATHVHPRGPSSLMGGDMTSNIRQASVAASLRAHELMENIRAAAASSKAASVRAPSMAEAAHSANGQGTPGREEHEKKPSSAAKTASVAGESTKEMMGSVAKSVLKEGSTRSSIPRSPAPSQRPKSSTTSVRQPSRAPSLLHPSMAADTTRQPSRAPSHHEPSVAGSARQPSHAPSHHEPSVAGSARQLSRAPSHHEPSVAGSARQPSHVTTHHEPSAAGSAPQPSGVPSHHEPSVAGSAPQPSGAPSHHEPSVAGSAHQPSHVTSNHVPSVAGSAPQPSGAPSHHEPSVPSVARSARQPSRAPSSHHPSAAADGQDASVAATEKAPSVVGSANAPSGAGSIKDASVVESAKAPSLVESAKALSIIETAKEASIVGSAKAESVAPSAKTGTVAGSASRSIAETVAGSVKALSMAKSARSGTVAGTVPGAQSQAAGGHSEAPGEPDPDQPGQDEQAVSHLSKSAPATIVGSLSGEIIGEAPAQDSPSMADNSDLHKEEPSWRRGLRLTPVNPYGEWIRFGRAGFKFHILEASPDPTNPPLLPNNFP
ncbi:hypothetical protein VP01_825g1 [Puccinia sorghi]|uniref:Uncharacterized protein n=1 Tax=Puccinia sorghi TaxID=27349 RepID=A0A0L6UBY6_9BASI|nr:hypothetical protein VP01_825g1 [Puccinia sorghi]